MCGIIGYVGGRDGVPFALKGLYRLEYRGYDSAGLGGVTSTGLRVHRITGKVRKLEDSLPKDFRARTVIGHTRWATHGEPSDRNAHPHRDCGNTIAVVHNGIIENAADLRLALQAKGHVFTSDTDTETLVHLIEDGNGGGFYEAVRNALSNVEGTYGIIVMDARYPECLIVARNGSPVVLGEGHGEMFVASDQAAFARVTDRVIVLDDLDIAVLTPDNYDVFTMDNVRATRNVTLMSTGEGDAEKGSYEHFLAKEIEEQPEASRRALRGRLREESGTVRLDGPTLSPSVIADIDYITVLGCGSAYYAGMWGAQLLKMLTRIPANAEPASEFRYSDPVIKKNGLYIAISQSGETADTLAAIKLVMGRGAHVMGVVNAVGSSIARECGKGNGGTYIHAGPEISVAATKTFTNTLLNFALLGLHLGRARDLSQDTSSRLIPALARIPDQIQEILEGRKVIREIAAIYANHPNAYFIGRGNSYPIALEGAQKVKEVAYVHAEAYPASELKHGPLALISPDFPTFVVIPHDRVFEKTFSSLREVESRKGPVIAITDRVDTQLEQHASHVIVVPETAPEIQGILLTIPLQLLAYYMALELGREIDQPRNLAKSVTVE